MTNLNRREWLAGTVALGVAGALRSRSFAAAPAPDGLDHVHPELRPFVSAMKERFGAMPSLTRETLAEWRKGGFGEAPLRTDVPHETRTIPVGAGHPDVEIEIVNAKPGAKRGAILHTHGGGFVLGTAASAVRELQSSCAALDCVAVSVNYRLAPETTYAGSIEDNYAGLKWLYAHAEELGADPARIAVMGESAGGGHAALLAITARDRGEVPVAFQQLIYPMLDDRTGSSREPPPHVGTILWTRESNRFGWGSFLGTAPGKKKAPGGVPARVENLKGLPPAFIGVGSIDLFHDEDVDYAQRLNAAGVMTELIVVPGAFHGFDGLAADAPITKWFNAAKLDALRRGLGPPETPSR